MSERWDGKLHQGIDPVEKKKGGENCPERERKQGIGRAMKEKERSQVKARTAANGEGEKSFANSSQREKRRKTRSGLEKNGTLATREGEQGGYQKIRHAKRTSIGGWERPMGTIQEKKKRNQEGVMTPTTEEKTGKTRTDSSLPRGKKKASRSPKGKRGGDAG